MTSLVIDEKLMPRGRSTRDKAPCALICCTIVKYKIGNGVMLIQPSASKDRTLQTSELSPAGHALKADDLLPESLHQFLAC